MLIIFASKFTLCVGHKLLDALLFGFFANQQHVVLLRNNHILHALHHGQLTRLQSHHIAGRLIEDSVAMQAYILRLIFLT